MYHPSQQFRNWGNYYCCSAPATHPYYPPYNYCPSINYQPIYYDDNSSLLGSGSSLQFQSEYGEEFLVVTKVSDYYFHEDDDDDEAFIVFQCQVCLKEIVSTPVFQCHDRHLICVSCRSAPFCGKCGKVLKNPLKICDVVEKAIRKIPKHYCPHLTCHRRMVARPGKIQKHMDRFHRVRFSSKIASHEDFLPISFRFKFGDNKIVNWLPVEFNIHGDLFYAVFYRKDRRLYLWVYYEENPRNLSNKRLDERYYCIIKLKGNDDINSITFRGDIYPLTMSKDYIIRKGLGLSISDSKIKNLMGKYGESLEYKINILSSHVNTKTFQ